MLNLALSLLLDLNYPISLYNTIKKTVHTKLWFLSFSRWSSIRIDHRLFILLKFIYSIVLYNVPIFVELFYSYFTFQIYTSSPSNRFSHQTVWFFIRLVKGFSYIVAFINSFRAKFVIEWESIIYQHENMPSTQFDHRFLIFFPKIKKYMYISIDSFICNN